MVKLRSNEGVVHKKNIFKISGGSSRAVDQYRLGAGCKGGARIQMLKLPIFLRLRIPTLPSSLLASHTPSIINTYTLNGLQKMELLQIYWIWIYFNISFYDPPLLFQRNKMQRRDRCAENTCAFQRYALCSSIFENRIWTFWM